VDKSGLDVNMMNLILKNEVNRISATPSVVARPRIRTGNSPGIGMAVATAANLQSLAYALQAQVGLEPDDIRLALYSENGVAKVLVSGNGSGRGITFEQVVIQNQNETVVALVHRAALVGLALFDPYITALNLMRRHELDKDFSDVQSLVEYTKAKLPPKPVSADRSLLENMQGIMALFGGDPSVAHAWFERAAASSPANVIAQLNLAFADLQIDHYRDAADRMQVLLADGPPADPIVAGTAYMTWAGALLGLGDVNGADRLMLQATKVNPQSAVAFNLWSDVKREKGDPETASLLRQKALDVSDSFENYAEVAALYFQLAWRNHQPMITSQFRNPAAVSFH
jgi:tetratricopeptide (TPR) repeat protein